MDRDRIGGHARYGCATITIRTTPYVDARGSNETTHRLSFRIRASGCTAALHTAGGVRIRARADLWRRSERRIYRNDSGLVDRRWGPVGHDEPRRWTELQLRRMERDRSQPRHDS